MFLHAQRAHGGDVITSVSPTFMVNVISALILRGSRHTIVFLKHCPQTPGMSDILSDGSQAQNWLHNNSKTLFGFFIVLKFVLTM